MATLDQLAQRVRSLGPRMMEAALPEIAEALRDELRISITGGTTPDGKAWEDRKSGGRPLTGALEEVHIAVMGDKIIVRLTGVEARHHRGRAKGGVVREIIPTGALPQAWARAIKRVLDRKFAEAING